MTIKQEEQKAWPSMISRADAERKALNAFSSRVNVLSEWVGRAEEGLNYDAKDAAIIALAQINGAYGMMRDILDALEEI